MDLHARDGSIVILLPAAGKSSRTAAHGQHKLLVRFEGVPLIRRSTDIALQSRIGPVIVVTGYRADEMAETLSDTSAIIVHNAQYETGMAGSLITGFSTAEARQADAVMVMLPDMPGITSENLCQLAAAFHQNHGQAIVCAAANGIRGNPVIVPRVLYSEISKLRGDTGARRLIETAGLPVVDIEIGDAARRDVDTLEDLLAAGGDVSA